ncbi:hypothetical protein B0H15DRAFT_845140 [Mycena belliarum]|uniref:Uncharacterized protein n=1 Tax=Mycena belliarum TaxID=1033014 RepID=A0AAD6U136_9AGAR|nr:hypothetical protein B0H15DRAFT_845140 [Mycena belliae]
MPPVELDPSVEKTLVAFENGAEKGVDCQTLLVDSFQTFSLLERWESADSNVPAVMSIIKKVRQQGHVYFETLDDSINVAQNLYEYALSAKQLASSLIEGSEPNEIQAFIAEMRADAQRALEKSKHISGSLREVRKGINRISDIIPSEMARLERQERKLWEKSEALERRIAHVRIAKTVGTTALAVVGGVSMIVFPPMMLILPVGLPIAILALEVYENRSSKTLTKRDDEILDCRHGLQELENITTCLARFAEHINNLTEFWLRSDTMLETISNGVRLIRGNTVRMRLKSIIGLWEEAAELYMRYVVKLKGIQDIDCGASSSLRSKKSSSSTRDRLAKNSRGCERKKITSPDSEKTELQRRNATRSRSSSSSSARH